MHKRNIFREICAPLLHADTIIQVEANLQRQAVSVRNQTLEVWKFQRVNHWRAISLIVPRAAPIAAGVRRFTVVVLSRHATMTSVMRGYAAVQVGRETGDVGTG
jgi:hypothetical protein